MASHRLLTSLKAKRPAFGIWQTLPGHHFSRTLGAASEHLSWICLDCEHGLIPLQGGASECISAINGSVGNDRAPPSVLVRIPATGISTGTGWQLKFALDAGAHGVVVPMVNTAAKAAEIVQDCRFPPNGRRGFGNPFTPAMWNKSAQGYMADANDQIVVMVQIETKEAVENLEEIAAVPGVDVLFIGPFDLSLSLGFHTPNPDPHPEVEKIIQRIRDVAHKNGKGVAFYCSSGKQARKRAEEGFDIINVTNDVGAMAEGISNHLADAVGVAK